MHHFATAGISGRNPGVSEKGKITFKAGITLEDLLAQASEKTDLQAAQQMQQAKADLSALFNKCSWSTASCPEARDRSR